ncbi:MAG: hypothetical protein DRQ65_05200 [Gammaproteobacteria bacterium]|nr:MAG: hypothetical protein DRQ65_05200 [Gammaproteobacteria bacterium]RLA55421.1 MAG: hypothetical protein DRQ98_05190 [Gammaproteobacteria bacterium]HDY83926.1 helix-turn-helix domain-containing protein [Halieaceae bacterium]
MMKDKEDLLAPQRFTTDECMELNEVSRLNKDWRTDYQQVGAGKFKAWFDLYASSNLRFTDQYCSQGMSVSGIAPDDHVALVLPLNRGDRGVFQGREFGANDVGLMVEHSECFYRTPRNLRMMVVTIPVSRLPQALDAAAHKRELYQMIAETSVISLDNATIASLTSATRRVFEIIQSTSQPAGLALCLQEIEEHIVTTLSLVMAGSPGPARGALGRKNRLRYLERARTYIEAHLESPLGMETLTLVAGTSTRSLETAFREVLGVTPVQYIRYSRLNAAKSRLLRADSAMTSVTDTAQALGFSHLSRFAQNYRALFGELPSATLAA